MSQCDEFTDLNYGLADKPCNTSLTDQDELSNKNTPPDRSVSYEEEEIEDDNQDDNYTNIDYKTMVDMMKTACSEFGIPYCQEVMNSAAAFSGSLSVTEDSFRWMMLGYQNAINQRLVPDIRQVIETLKEETRTIQEANTRISSTSSDFTAKMSAIKSETLSGFDTTRAKIMESLSSIPEMLTKRFSDMISQINIKPSAGTGKSSKVCDEFIDISADAITMDMPKLQAHTMGRPKLNVEPDHRDTAMVIRKQYMMYAGIPNDVVQKLSSELVERYVTDEDLSILISASTSQNMRQGLLDEIYAVYISDVKAASSN